MAEKRASDFAAGIRTGVASTHLLDTGFLVALADQRDPNHRECRAAWSQVRGKLVTVEGVLVEAAHLVQRNPGGFETVLGIVRSVGTELVPPAEDRYQRAVDLMRRYRDVPMDLVDALLVAVAEERGLESILTLDQRGFRTYRMHGRRRFSILPVHRG